MDLKLDPLTGDLAMDGLDLALTSGQEAVAQRLLVRLRFFRGEWFLDRGAGVPWFQDILGKGRSIRAVEAVLRRAVLETRGVKSILSLTLDYNQSARKLSVGLAVDTDVGRVTMQEVL